MKQIKKVLFSKNIEVPLAWRDDKKAHTQIEVVFYFDLKLGARFRVNAGNVSFCDKSLFKAFCQCLEHESVGMAKYDNLKDDVRAKNFWQKLGVNEKEVRDGKKFFFNRK